MISIAAQKSVNSIMHTACNILQLVPYTWDSARQRLICPTKIRMRIYHFHTYVLGFMLGFTIFRFMCLFVWDDVPVRSIQLNGMWMQGYTLTGICFYQFNKNTEEIMWFANALLNYIDKNPIKPIKEGQRKKMDIISICVVISGFLYYINPPAHTVTTIDNPCVPHFLSSLVFPCRTTYEDTQPWYQKVPFFIIEDYFVTMIITTWSFNWTFIFLGFAWLKRELRSTTVEPSYTDAEGNAAKHCLIEKYRQVQFINGALNDAFKYYLQWFPSLLLGIIVLNIFAGLRFLHLPLYIYLMAPACGLRCLFESMTPLSLAGYVNRESIKVLDVWRQEARILGNKSVSGKFIQLYHKSCRIITCAAGSLYTFESTIVLVSVDLCISVTVNLLLMTKNLN